jgi:sirohydrochlorin cobaltochelatase
MADDFSDSTLILAAHGSTKNNDSAKPALKHADSLRERQLFAEVRVGFLKQLPSLNGLLHNIQTQRVFIVPLFISNGYYTEQVLPHTLGFDIRADTSFERLRYENGQMLYYCEPIGTHNSITEALLALAKGIVERHPFPSQPKPSDTTLFIAGHGTEKNEHSRVAIEQQAERIRAQCEYADVKAVFMEEEPLIEKCYELAVTKNIIMVPFFISDGLHSNEDIPVMLGETEKRVRNRLANGQPTWVNPTERRGKRLWYSASIGTEPFIVEVILERVREATER